MIAKSGNNFLGREGLVANGATNVSSGYNNDGFSNTQFSIYLPVGSYSEPKKLSPINSGQLRRGSTTSCTVTILADGGSWVAGSNAMGDFSVHCILASIQSEPYWTPGTTTFNCVVTGYDNNTGDLSFNATPDISGPCRFIVLVRSGLGTGELITTLRTSSDSTVDAAPSVSVTGASTMGISTRVFNGATYTCVRASGTLNVPSDVSCEILLVAGGGGGGFTGGGAGGAGGVVHITNASIKAGNYSVTIGDGGAGGDYDGEDGGQGGNTTAFGLVVYGGGGGSHDDISAFATGGSGGGGGWWANSTGGTKKSHTGEFVSDVSGTATSYGNNGGTTGPETAGLISGYACSGGGGAGGVGGAGTLTSGGYGGAGGAGSSTWSDWCAACLVGERNSAGTFYIAGGGGGSSAEVSSARRAGVAGIGGGGRGGQSNTYSPPLGWPGCASNGMNYSGGGGGGGHTILKTSFSQNNVAGKGGCGVIIIKQTALPAAVPSPALPNSVGGLQVWFDGSDPLNTGSKPGNDVEVSTWKDRSGNNRHAIAYVSGQNALFREGQNEGLPSACGALFFSNTPYEITMNFNPATYTIICVFRADGPVNNSNLQDSINSLHVISGGSNTQLWFGVDSGCYTARTGTGSVWHAGTTPQLPAYGVWSVMTMQYTDSSKTVNRWVNGVAFDSLTNLSAQNGGSAWNNLYIGQYAQNTSDQYKLRGCIAEIAIYNTVLSTADRKSVEAGLSQKYGVGISP